jgi:hypothetical protein
MKGIAYSLLGHREFHALVEVARCQGARVAFNHFAISPTRLQPGLHLRSRRPRVLVHALVTFGAGGLKRLVSIPGCLALLALAVPRWVAAAIAGGREQFVQDFVFNDQLLYYFTRYLWNWQVMVQPIILAVTVLVPWSVLLPFAIRRALRQTDPVAGPNCGSCSSG